MQDAMDSRHCLPQASWLLPGAAWQVVARYLLPAELLSARLVCRVWRKDLGAFVPSARIAPEQLAATPEPHCRRPSGGARLLAAFPHCACITLDISSCSQRSATSAAIGQLVAVQAPSTLSRGSSSSSSQDAAATHHHKLPQGMPVLQLDAARRSYHCPASAEHPAIPDDADAVFEHVAALPAELAPKGLLALHTVRLAAPPRQASAWAALACLPGLRALELPSFRPALSHEQLPLLARHLEQLTALTLSVQGSFTAWRSNCEAFASLRQLSRLRQLSLHAFHCPGGQLASALQGMLDLEDLRLSGRIVLAPLSSLAQLTRLRVLALTQDVQYRMLCDLLDNMPCLQHLAVGRIAQLPLASQQHLTMASEVVSGTPDAPTAPAAAHLLQAGTDGVAAAAMVAGGGAVAGGVGGGEGEVMLEDVGAIVDGLIGNLADGDVPLHLQRIIERFESIIQLDLTRRSSSAPWAWPVHGTAIALGDDGSCCQAGIHAGAALCASSNLYQHAQPCASLELALLRPGDVPNLCELPEQLRRCCALSLRLRDQLLAFASVSPVHMQRGQLSDLGNAFPCLTSLTVGGKIGLNGLLLLELSCSCPQLTTLSLDCHFTSVGAAQLSAALSGLRHVQTLCLRHRGSGKLPVAVAALPASLKMLAFKKLMLYGNRLYTLDCTDCAENGVLLPAEMQQSAPLGTQGADAAVGHDALELHDVECHAITSPDFQQRAATGMLSRAASAADALSVSMLDSRSTGVLVGSTKSEFEARSGHNCVALPSPNAQLPNLSSLHLRNCLISDGAARHLFGATAECSRADVGCQTATHHLTCLAVTGDSGSEELASGLSTWLTQLSSLQGLQVMDITLPDCIATEQLSFDLLAVLPRLCNLQHLHLNVAHRPEILIGLTRLSQLRTLAVSYTGPPSLPNTLLAELQHALGPSSCVQLWESIVMQHSSSFDTGGGSTHGRSRRHRYSHLCGSLLRIMHKASGWGFVMAASWCLGWSVGGTLGRGRRKQ